MSRGASGAVLAPVGDAVPESGIDSDHRLVAAVRRGDDRAFEALYQRYQRRIHAYVFGMVKDHGRAEDVTQEVFVSALRRMRATERPIAFRPWIYEIAKNACIDAFRRSRRGEEVSFDAEGALGPADHSRLVGGDPSPEAAVAAKHDLETLCGAFGGLSESHHRILVLRELEGLSYEQIGAQMGLTRPAVESTLFRARRRLTEEYDELVSGARCARVQAIIAAAAAGAVGVRDTRRLSRHLAHCQVCRREALAAGLDRGLLVRRPVRRVAEKIAGLLPLPGFLVGRRADVRRASAPADSWTSPPASAGDARPGAWTSPPTAASPPPGAGLAAHLPALSDQLSAPWSKAVAGVALLLAGVGTGVGVQQATRSHPATPRLPATAIHRSAHISRAASVAAPGASVTAQGASSRSRGARGEGAAGSARHRSSVMTHSGAGGGRATSGGGSTATPTPAAGGSSSSSGSSGSSGSAGTSTKTPKVQLPTTTSDPVKQVTDSTSPATTPVTNAANGAADTAADTVKDATGAVEGATEQATGTVTQTTKQLTGDGPVSSAVGNAGNTVNTTVGGVKPTVDRVADTTTDTVKQATGALLGPH